MCIIGPMNTEAIAVNAQTPEEMARSYIAEICERRNAALRARPIYETTLGVIALGADWECRVRFQIERYEADVGGGIGIDYVECHIRPADVRLKSDWLPVDERELDMDVLEQACLKQVQP